ncbi:hypothetical protein AB0N73_01825 [Microbacterium sp. NPDC089189]|uniref:hypothetical protein n=1 Tax=Microbacterium sp. NPDC089189 TaxID=3154972 RepID=UPI0034387B01
MRTRSGGRVAALLTACAVLLGCSVSQTTAAAWTDDILATAAASAGHWVAQRPVSPFAPGEATTIVGTPTWTFDRNNTTGFCADIPVSTLSAAATRWSILVALDSAPFWGAAPSGMWVESGAGTIAAVPGTSGRAVLRGSGGAAVVSAGTPIIVRLCAGSAMPAPVGDPSWYTVDTAAAGPWTRTQACVLTTVRSVVDPDAYPYAFAWTATVDLSGAEDAVRAAGGTPTHVSWDPDGGAGNRYTLTPRAGRRVVGDVAAAYDLTSGVAAELRGAASFVVTACVNGF